MREIERWFEENKRDFPWREEKTPYRVWISEVMLQQTRASVVIPYFLRWMDLFPDVNTLYMAKIEDVIKTWEGLGYYSRARNLHLAAKQIVEEFDGKIPDTREDLMRIRGFGPYTVGAILSFAFQKRAAAVDGNVLRVMSRYFAIEENVSKGPIRKRIEEKTEEFLDPQIPWVTSEALIELGATVCIRNPKCEICPLEKNCLAKRLGIAASLPIKNSEKAVQNLTRHVFVVVCEGSVLVKKGVLGKVMADLYEFPFLEVTNPLTRAQMMNEAEKMFGKPAAFVSKLTECSHTFTRYKARLLPFVVSVSDCHAVDACEWVQISQISSLPFSSGHRKIVAEVEKIYLYR